MLSQFSEMFQSPSPTTKKVLICYGVGSAVCMALYGYRYAKQALREYHIKKRKKGHKVEAGTKRDVILWGSLYGVVKGLIPSFFWPMIFTSYGIMICTEESILKELDNELEEEKKLNELDNELEEEKKLNELDNE